MSHALNMKNQCLQNSVKFSGQPPLGRPSLTKSAAPKATVCVVNGKEKMRDSLYRMIKAAGWDTKAYSSAEAFLGDVDRVSPSCLLLDVDAPSMGGFTLQGRLHEQHNLFPIMFVSTRGTVPEAVQALQAGAADFIIEPFRRSVLLDQIKECVAKSRRDQEAQKQREEIAARIAKLTPREREVMELVVKGKLNKVIASELNISIKTVEIHRAQVMKKLHAESRAELIRLAMVGLEITGQIDTVS